MMRKGGYTLLAVLTCVALLPGCCSHGKEGTVHLYGGLLLRRAFFITFMLNCTCTGSPTVVIDVYTHNSNLTSGDSVSLGTQLILVCQVVGLSYGTPLNYTWTCPNGPCEEEGYHGRKVYNEHILAANITSTSD